MSKRMATKDIKVGRRESNPRAFTHYLSIIENLFNTGYEFSMDDGHDENIDSKNKDEIISKISEGKKNIEVYLNGESSMADFLEKARIDPKDFVNLCTYMIHTDILDNIKIVKFTNKTVLYLPKKYSTLIEDEDIGKKSDEYMKNIRLESQLSQPSDPPTENVQHGTDQPEETEAAPRSELDSTKTRVGNDKGTAGTVKKGNGNFVKILIAMIVFVILILLLYSIISEENDTVISYQPSTPDYKEMGVVSLVGLPPLENQQLAGTQRETEADSKTDSKLVANNDNINSSDGIDSPSDIVSHAEIVLINLRGGKNDDANSLSASRLDADEVNVSKPGESSNPNTEPINQRSKVNGSEQEKPDWFVEDKLSYRIQILLPSGADNSELSIDNDDVTITKNFNSYVIDFGNNNPDKYTIKCLANGELICNIIGNDDIVNASMNNGVEVRYGYGFVMPKDMSQEKWPNVQWMPEGSIKNYKESIDTAKGITRKNCYWQINNGISQADLGLSLNYDPTGAELKVNSKSIKSYNMRN